MQSFTVTRKQMSHLLLSLNGCSDKTPLMLLQEAWRSTHRTYVEHGTSLSAFMDTSIPPIFEKIMKADQQQMGFSLNDIVALGNQIEYSNFSITAIQNWVKRDIREFLGRPRLGKKYSVQQAALIYIVEDLRATMDFDSIRKLLSLIFNDPDTDSDDLITPLCLYEAYSSIFEELDANNDQLLDVAGHEISRSNQDHMLEHLIKHKAERYVSRLSLLNPEQKEIVQNAIVIALISVQSSYFLAMARRYYNATLFLHRL